MSLNVRLIFFGLLLFPAWAGAVAGRVESVRCEALQGWAYDPAQPDAAVAVTAYRDEGIVLATFNADQFRQDLADQGYGNGKHGFVYPLPVTWQTHDGKPHRYSLKVNGAELPGSPQTTRTCYPKLNDTGISLCGTGDSTNGDCPAKNYPGQDGQSGRDRQAKAGRLSKQGAGVAGFDYTKIANDGSELPATATLGSGPQDWACTRDNVTGLIWEVKTDDAGVRDKDNRYSFDQAAQLAATVNQTGLCGAKDWRVPNRQALQSLVYYGRVDPAIDTDYFPNTVGSGFWSSSPYVGDSNGAWLVLFDSGIVGLSSRSDGYAVRLVRGG